jgi:hypothetical protein
VAALPRSRFLPALVLNAHLPSNATLLQDVAPQVDMEAPPAAPEEEVAVEHGAVETAAEEVPAVAEEAAPVEEAAPADEAPATEEAAPAAEEAAPAPAEEEAPVAAAEAEAEAQPEAEAAAEAAPAPEAEAAVQPSTDAVAAEEEVRCLLERVFHVVVAWGAPPGVSDGLTVLRFTPPPPRPEPVIPRRGEAYPAAGACFQLILGTVALALLTTTLRCPLHIPVFADIIPSTRSHTARPPPRRSPPAPPSNTQVTAAELPEDDDDTAAANVLGIRFGAAEIAKVRGESGRRGCAQTRRVLRC